jgi:3-oxoacyl-[acyl-carrier-protein] synthase II
MCGARPLRPEPITVVGAGVATPVGLDLDSFWSGLLAGSDGLSAIERFPVGDLRVGRGGEIKKLPPVAAGVRSRAAALLIAAAADLKGRVSLEAAPERIAVVVGTALGGVEELEHAVAGDTSPRRALDALYDAPAHALAAWLDARGPAITVSSACASGATALGLGADLLREGQADLVVAGGYDILCRFVLRGFDALRSLTRDRVRPFDRRRSGLLLGEAAGLTLLARERDAPGRSLGRLLGHGSASDASHIAAPDPAKLMCTGVVSFLEGPFSLVCVSHLKAKGIRNESHLQCSGFVRCARPNGPSFAGPGSDGSSNACRQAWRQSADKWRICPGATRFPRRK